MSPPPWSGTDLPSAGGVLPSTDEVLQNAGPFGYQLGFGGLAGYAAARALQTAGRIGLVLAGGTFVALQGLQYSGYMTVNWCVTPPRRACVRACVRLCPPSIYRVTTAFP